MSVISKSYDFLRSVKLALALLIAILLSCAFAVTVFPQQAARAVIFSSLWFNALLVCLIVNIGFCFFGRILRRKLTFVSLGMILFHLSFVAIFGGIAYNSLFYFRGAMRLTEGETLPNGHPQSYDVADWGRFFDHSKLKGETTLARMHTHYMAGGEDKGVANEISVGEGSAKKQGFVYITKNLDYNGFRYFRDRDGFSVLIVLYDKQGRELYGAYVPLQSLKQEDGSYLYTSGTAAGPGSFSFPHDTMEPLFSLQLAYYPDPRKERAGEVHFKVWPAGAGHVIWENPLAEGKAAIGETFDAGGFYLSMNEVRYWASMNVRHDPGLPIILSSLWVGLGGITLTTIGRLRRGGGNGKGP